MKRLRKQYGPGIRFYACGEYGEEFGRPHYHACLFNHTFPDQVPWKESNGETLYRSPQLEILWPYGYSSVGAVTFKSAAYVARYIMKKINGPLAESHYQGRKPEFTSMSRRPGVGARWLEKYATDVYPDDFIIINGKRVRPPRYYDQNFEIIEPEALEMIKRKRKENLRKHADNNTPERLLVREIIQLTKLQQLKRNHEKE